MKHQHANKNLDKNNLLDNIPAFIYQYTQDIDENMHFTYLSDNIQEYLGCSLEEGYKLGREFFSLVHPEDQASVSENAKRGLSELTTVSHSFRILHKAGKTVWVQGTSSHQKQKNGNILVTGCLVDITESKLREGNIIIETEEAKEILHHLDSKNKQFARTRSNIISLLDLLPLGVFIKNRAGGYIYANNFYCSLMGFDSFFDLQQHNWKEIMQDRADINKIEEHDEFVFKTGIATTVNDLSILDKNNDTRYFNATKSSIYISNDIEPDILSICYETTHMKQAEIERKMYIEELTIRNKNLEQFAYIISHNLRNPVTTILGVSNWMLKNINHFDPTAQALFDGLNLATKKVDGVIRDLNELLSMQGKKKYENVVFSEVLTEVSALLNEGISANNIAIIGNFESASEISSIKAYVHSVFYNLISNSICYRRKDIQTIIEISSSKVDDCIKLVFKDNGIGIDMDSYGSLVFDLYKQFHGHSEGRGMGLFMVKTQVELLKGAIDIKSQPGIGTELIIHLKQLQ
jgi:PAS domain S-box-containing protein